MATQSNILAWGPTAEKPGRLQSLGHRGVGHDLVTKTPTTAIPGTCLCTRWKESEKESTKIGMNLIFNFFFSLYTFQSFFSLQWAYSTFSIRKHEMLLNKWKVAEPLQCHLLLSYIEKLIKLLKIALFWLPFLLKMQNVNRNSEEYPKGKWFTGWNYNLFTLMVNIHILVVY